MNSMRKLPLVVVLSLSFVSSLAVAAPPGVKKAPPPPPPEFAEIKQMFGAVPTFMRAIPPAHMRTTWEGFKAMWFGKTALPNKLKNLISVAVASQVPCKYCVYADSKFAELEGATPEQVTESVMMASLTRLASTVLNGSLQDEKEFMKEVDAMLAFAKKAMASGKAPPEINVIDAASATADMKATFGMVPSFAKKIPPAMVATMWRQLKELQLNPGTALTGKEKELIGLAVAAQIPCKYCIYMHREVAKLNGATQAEIDEAVYIAGDTRYWSTFFHGIQLDEAGFKKEFDAMIKHLKKAMAGAKSPSPAAPAKP